MAWCNLPVRGVLSDITGVLYEGGSSVAIPGSVEALNRLRAAGIGVRLVTNESAVPVAHLVKKLQAMGFSISDEDVSSPVSATVRFLQERQLVPHLLVNPAVEGEFGHLPRPSPTTPPTCVVVGDADHSFTYEAMNKAFRTLKAMERPLMLSMGAGRYYKHKGELQLDVGPFVKALEWAVSGGVEVEVIGKPTPSFFLSALSAMGVKPEEAIMVGDDIEGDVGGAQGGGIRGVLVRTGKFTHPWENHPHITPTHIGDNLAGVVEDVVGRWG